MKKRGYKDIGTYFEQMFRARPQRIDWEGTILTVIFTFFGVLYLILLFVSNNQMNIPE